MARPHYLTKEQLTRIVLDAQAQQRVTEELCSALKLICEGISLAQRKPDVCPEELWANVTLIVMRILPTIRVEKNVFSYFTTLAKHELWCLAKKEARRKSQVMCSSALLEVLRAPDEPGVPISDRRRAKTRHLLKEQSGGEE